MALWRSLFGHRKLSSGDPLAEQLPRGCHEVSMTAILLYFSIIGSGLVWFG